MTEHVLVSAGCVLLGPVHLGGLIKTTEPELEEGRQVPHYSQIVGVLPEGHSRLWEFPLVKHQVGPLCCGQSEECNLVELHQEHYGGPRGVEESQAKDAQHPGRAADQGRQSPPNPSLLVEQRAVARPVLDTTIEHPGSHQREGEEKEDKKVMISGSYAAIYPNRVMVLLGNTGVTGVAVIGSHGLLNHTGSAENPGVQAACLCQNHNIHLLLLLGGLHHARVRPAGAEVVVEKSSDVEREQHLYCGTRTMLTPGVKEHHI